MRTIAVFGLVCATMVGGTLISRVAAADLDPGLPPPPAYSEPDAPFEFGTGWYLRGDVGWSDTTREALFNDLPNLTASSDWVGGIGAGYRWNNWLRTDLTLNFDGYQDIRGLTSDITCVYQLRVQTTPDGSQNTGLFWTPNLGTCDGHRTASILKTDVMVGGYIDIGTWSGITPYVGAGVGFSRIDTWNGQNYTKTSDGSPYNTDLTAPGGVPLVWRDQFGNIVKPVIPNTNTPVGFVPQNWSRSTHSTQYNFAWSLAGGVAYAVDDHLSVDLGYRYVNLGSYTDALGHSKTIDAQQVKLGFRYAID